MSNFVLDVARLPLCKVVFAEELEDDEIPLLFAQTRELFASRQRLVLLVDASDSKLTAHQRKLMVTYMKRHEDEYRRWIACGAIVVRSALARGTMTALLWMMTPPYEQKVFQKLDEAEAWVAERVKALRMGA